MSLISLHVSHLFHAAHLHLLVPWQVAQEAAAQEAAQAAAQEAAAKAAQEAAFREEAMAMPASKWKALMVSPATLTQVVKTPATSAELVAAAWELKQAYQAQQVPAVVASIGVRKQAYEAAKVAEEKAAAEGTEASATAVTQAWAAVAAATKNQAEAAAEAALASGDEAVWKKWQGMKLATAMDLVEELPEPEKIREVTLSAIDAVLPAMTKLSSGMPVGCYVIARMLEDSWQVDRSIEVKAMVEKGAIQALAKAMEKHPLDEKVQDFALFALERILTLSLDVKYLTFQIPSDPSLVAAWNALESVPHDMVKAGVLELAAAAMGKYEKNEGLQAGGDVLTHQLECLQGSFESTSLVPEGIEAC